jgi:PAS domain S-box-containing protein
MQDGTYAFKSIPAEDAAPAVRGGISLLWPALAGISVALAAGASITRLMAGPRYDGLLIFAACAAVVVLGLRLLVPNAVPAEAFSATAPDPLKNVFESAGPGMVAIGLDGRLTYVNPAGERLLGYHADELMKEWATFDILGPGEGVRMVAELQKICGISRPPEATPAGRMAAYMECVRSLPPSKVPSFDVQLRRKDSTLLPVTLHISGLRDSSGALAGLVAVAVDQGATLRQDLALRESQERYRDLFEHSSEMIATLSPAGKFLYANPAWNRCFGKDTVELIELDSFDELFGPGCRSEVASHFRRALDGEVVDRAPLRYHTHDSRVLELELSLSQRFAA